MDRPTPDRDVAEVEALLSASRPSPGPAFEAELERRLFDRRARRTLQWRPALVGIAGATGLAALVAALALAGAGPLSSDGPSDVRAGDDCRYVTVTRPTRVPHVVRRSDGEFDIRFKRERAERIVKRCR